MSEPWSLAEIQRGINSQNVQDQLQATQEARKLLSRETHPPTYVIIHAGLISKFVSFLECSEYPPIQFEAALLLINFASGTSDQTTAVVEGGAIPIFIKMVSSPHPHISEQAILALGIIAGRGPFYRNLVIEHGGMWRLLNFVTSPDLSSFTSCFLRNVTWTLSKLCRNQDPASLPSLSKLGQLLPSLMRLLHHHDKEVVANSCWAVSFLTNDSIERIEAVVQAGLVPCLVYLLTCGEPMIMDPALQAIGNIVAGTDEQTQCVLNTGVLKVFPNLLRHQDSAIHLEAAWALTNIIAGKNGHIQEVIDAGLVPIMVEILQQGSSNAQMETVDAVTRYIGLGTTEQVTYLVHCGVLEPLFNMLTVHDNEVVLAILDLIYDVLEMSTEVGEFERLSEWMNDVGAVDKIVALQSHDSRNVSLAAFYILDTFYL